MARRMSGVYSPDVLLQARSAPLYISYRALRSIQKGEELYLDYGREWQDAWNAYTHQFRDWENNSFSATLESSADNLHKKRPTFRHYIDLPSSILPESW
mmetsp:Transcript_6845/g.11409  ORF Transcript_6845/g.11409 Transcript_6845/m.11409 type:complete len:99 (+) Transcript_6845:1-297(+)